MKPSRPFERDNLRTNTSRPTVPSDKSKPAIPSKPDDIVADNKKYRKYDSYRAFSGIPKTGLVSSRAVEFGSSKKEFSSNRAEFNSKGYKFQSKSSTEEIRSTSSSLSSDHSSSTSPESKRAWRDVRERSPVPSEPGRSYAKNNSSTSRLRPSSVNVGSGINFEHVMRRSFSVDNSTIVVHLGQLSNDETVNVDVEKNARADHVIGCVLRKIPLGPTKLFELAETFSSGGQLCKERRLESHENPVRLQMLWPRVGQATSPVTELCNQTEYRFYLRKKDLLDRQHSTGSWIEQQEPSAIEKFLSTFLQPTMSREYPDLCNLPDLNESTLMENLRTRFNAGHIYTYVGTILIALNPFKFFPIYNPKYVRLYQNKVLSDLPPHIFAIADSAYHKMLSDRSNQCIVISGESGSGKTESTNLLLHHLSALSQRGLHNTGIEQTILGAGPVLEVCSFRVFFVK